MSMEQPPPSQPHAQQPEQLQQQQQQQQQQTVAIPSAASALLPRSAAKHDDSKPDAVPARNFGSLTIFVAGTMGLANVWQFPRAVAENSTTNGSLHFVLAWIVCLAAWSVPLTMAEAAIGRSLRGGPVYSLQRLLGWRTRWRSAFASTCLFFVASYFCVIVGWCWYYVCLFFVHDTTALHLTSKTQPSLTCDVELPAIVASWQLWDGMLGTPWPQLLHVLVALAAGSVTLWRFAVYESLTMALVPLTIVILFCSAALSWSLPNAGDGLRHLFTPDWDALASTHLWSRALIQSSWDAAAGLGLYTCQAARLDRRSSVIKRAVLLPIVQLGVALLATTTLFASAFSGLRSIDCSGEQIVDILQASPPASAGIYFIGMPVFVAAQRVGPAVCVLFFLALALGGVLSLSTLVELLVHGLEDLGVRRRQGGAAITFGVIAFGLVSAFQLEFLENQQWVWRASIVLSGLLVSTAVLGVGPYDFRSEIANSEVAQHDWLVPTLWSWWCAIVVPATGLAAFAMWIYDAVDKKDGSEWYQVDRIDSVMTAVAQWVVVLAISFIVNRIMAYTSVAVPTTPIVRTPTPAKRNASRESTLLFSGGVEEQIDQYFRDGPTSGTTVVPPDEARAFWLPADVPPEPDDAIAGDQAV